MKKTLSLILTLALVVTSFAFVSTTAYADDTNLLDSITYGIGTETGAFKDDPITYEGRDNVVHFGRFANKNTYLQFNEVSSEIDPSNYLVYEVSVILSENITNITLSNKTTSTTFEIGEYIIKDSWNDFKLVLKNNDGASGKLYINEKKIGTFTVADSTKALRISFDDPSKSKTVKEEIWLDTNSVKITEKTSLDLSEELFVDENGNATFNPASDVDGILIVVAYNQNGLVEKVNTKPVTGATTFASEFSGAYKYKAFVFDSLTSAIPLVESASSR